MLILQRKTNERIIIPVPGHSPIIITVVGIKHSRGGAVRLGFEAPAEIPVHREEVFQQILRESQDAGPNKQ